MSRLCLALLTGCITLNGIIGGRIAAADPPDFESNAHRVYVKRTNGDVTDVFIAAPTGNTNKLWNNDSNCGTAAHITSDNRRFAHWHMYDFDLSDDWDAYHPITGDPLTFTITGTDIKRFYDEEVYPQADYGGDSPTTVYNCWGFSFGMDDIWIQDPSYIYADDYDPTSEYLPGCVIEHTGHCVLMKQNCQIDENTFTARVTEEKNRSSGIYGETYDCPDGKTFTNQKYEPES